MAIFEEDTVFLEKRIPKDQRQSDIGENMERAKRTVGRIQSKSALSGCLPDRFDNFPVSKDEYVFVLIVVAKFKLQIFGKLLLNEVSTGTGVMACPDSCTIDDNRQLLP